MPGILLLAHGGPHSLEDVPAFLESVRGGRPTPDALATEVQERYRLIGGASPLPGITRRVAAALESACGLPVYVGMLYWHPFLEETIAQMAGEGIASALAICLVPQFSERSVGRYRHRALAAAEGLGLQLDFVESWHVAPPYVAALAASIDAARKELGSRRSDPEAQTHLIFTAHSLPRAALPAGDPYESQLRETAMRVAERLGLSADDWTLAYQSASGPAGDWLGPAVDDVVRDLSERGITHVAICALGFVADQVEILYDLDIATRSRAQQLGVTVARAQLLNDGPGLIDSLTLLVNRWRQ